MKHYLIAIILLFLSMNLCFATAPESVPPQETLQDCGSILVSSLRDADLYLDGVFQGKISAATPKVINEVAVGQHSLEARTLDKSESQNINVSKDQETKVFFAWVPANMVYVEGGSFTMGINNGEYDEKPAHEVTVSSFYIGKYEVTQGEYSRFVKHDLRWKKKHGLGDNYPAYSVTWYQVLEYCNLRSMAEGLTPCYSIAGSTDPNDWGYIPVDAKSEVWDAVVCNWNANGYRLPTEAEWEYAARGGAKSQGYLYSGSQEYESVAWHEGNSRKKSQTVGTKAANELGIYDMSGNLWEWCWDWYGAYDEDPQQNPTGSKNGNGRVLRGGSWRFNGPSSRVSYRASLSPRGSNYDYGFRLCRTVK